MKVNYYWYHHGLAWNPDDSKPYNDYKRIQLFLDSHDYERFMKMKAEYPDCLPDMASVYDENDDIVEFIDITIPENFMKITYSESECG